MKKIIMFCLLLVLVPLSVYAGACWDVEYAELKDMAQAEFLKVYCKVLGNYELHFNVWMESMTRMSPRREVQKRQDDVISCQDVRDRM